MEEQLVEKLNAIWEKAKTDSPLQQKSAVCIATIDAQGFPQSRFVDLKAVNQEGFVFCTSYDSPKGQNLQVNNKVSLTAWWDHIGVQIRVVGNAKPISDTLADNYWAKRTHHARVATHCFQQSHVWDTLVSMEAHFNQAVSAIEPAIPRPLNWGGFVVAPHSVELLEFAQSRVHKRYLYTKNPYDWTMQLLQP